MRSKRPSDPPPGERLQKALANLGLGSRREIERWIEAGRIRVDGKIATLGLRVTGDEQVMVDKQLVRLSQEKRAPRRVIIYNKPEGELVTRDDPEGRATVFKRLPKIKGGRWIAIGRLDINSSGLLLFTTDGELANRLMHPSGQVEREYSVRVLGTVTEEILKSLVEGVELEDGWARFEEVVCSGGDGANRWFHVVIMEGRKREVRRLWEATGVTVSRLKRVRFGPLFLGSLPVGRSRELESHEVEALIRATEAAPSSPSEKRRGGHEKSSKGRPSPRHHSPYRGGGKSGAKR